MNVEKHWFGTSDLAIKKILDNNNGNVFYLCNKISVVETTALHLAVPSVHRNPFDRSYLKMFYF